MEREVHKKPRSWGQRSELTRQSGGGRNQNIIKLISLSHSLVSVVSREKLRLLSCLLLAGLWGIKQFLFSVRFGREEGRKNTERRKRNYMFLCILKERWINKKFMKTRSCFASFALLFRRREFKRREPRHSEGWRRPKKVGNRNRFVC
jgi:hypothetical protein